jgi:hypothetical protein
MVFLLIQIVLVKLFKMNFLIFLVLSFILILIQLIFLKIIILINHMNEGIKKIFYNLNFIFSFKFNL